MEAIAAAAGSAATRIRAFAERFLAQVPGEDERFESSVFSETAHDPAPAGEFRRAVASLLREIAA